MPSQLPAIYLETDEAEDVAGSIRHALASWNLAKEDLHAHKWLLLAVHSALQGACVCHLTTTFAPVGATTSQNTVEWLEWAESRHSNPTLKQPKTKICSLPELLKRVRKPNSAGDGSPETGISISDSELSYLIRIHEDLRNQFTHFEPMGWVIDMSGVPAIAQLVARIIRDIQAGNWAFRHKDFAWHSSLSENLGLLESLS
jgi:hypothetical protein